MAKSGYQNVVELANRAEKALQLSASLIRSKATLTEDEDGEALCHWELFLEQSPSYETIETCAVNVGILSLLACGERTDHPLIQGAVNMMKKLQLEDGGWTSFAPSEEEPLTIEVFFALRALMKVGRDTCREPIERGIDWLRRNENDQSGGWGFYTGDKSFVVTTSYATRVFSEFYESKRQSILARDMINRGLQWLLDQQVDQKYWVRDVGEGPSTVQTSLALLALIAAGLTRYSSHVVNARNWILEHVDDREGAVDAYRVPKRGPGSNVIGFHRRIAHVSFPEGIIAQALLASGTSLLDPRLLDCIENLLDLQAGDGSWKCYSVAYEQPIWTVMDACVALSRFVQLAKSNEQFLEITEGIQGISKRFSEYESQQATLTEQLSSIQVVLQQIASTQEQITDTLQQHETNLTTLSGFSRDLFFLRPLAFVARLSVRFPLLVALIVVVTVWVILRLFGQVSSMWIDISIGILTAVLLGIEVFLYYKRK